ncbi:MAG: hypothetical protein AAF596_08880 [Planctomycetota bacterium]
MNRRFTACLFAAAVSAASLLPASTADAFVGRAIAQERAVRRMPLEQRPNRFGHVYGNQVRRRQAGRIVINSSDVRVAAWRYFYLP